MERFIVTDPVNIELFFNVFHIRNWDIFHSLGSTFIPLCRRSLPPGIGITVWQSMSFWKRWRWPHKNILRCMKRWTTIANADSMRLALCSGVSCFGTHLAHNFLNNRLLRDNLVQQGAGNLQEMTAGTADDDFRSTLRSVPSKTLSQTGLHSRRELE